MATPIYTIPTREVLESVGDKGYDNWTTCLTSYFLSQDLCDLIHSSSSQTRTPPPAAGEESQVNGEIDATPTATTTTTTTPATASPTWRRRNAAALHAIHISLGSDLLHQIRGIASAKEAWDTLADMHHNQLPPKDDSIGADQQINAAAGSTTNIASRYFRLITRVREGDTQGVRNFVGENHESARFRFPPGQGTALHLAATLGKVDVAKELLEWMDDEDLEIQDGGGSTALHIAAASGHRLLVQPMLERNSNLVKVVNKRKMIPLREACGKNHKELATLLYKCTPFNWLCEENDGKYGANILKCCILGQMFDIALDMLSRRPSMAAIKDTGKINVVIQLSSMPTAFPSGNHLAIWLQWIYL
ncbi:Ankyrin repeat-containing protein NPR4 [Linum grandiflorum]